MMQDKIKGGCLCGTVRFEVDQLLPEAGHCHCSMCRKFSGAAFSTFASASKSEFRWLQGEDFLTHYVADNKTTRTFCCKCGSSLLFAA